MKKEFEIRWESIDNLDMLMTESYGAIKDKIRIELSDHIDIYVMGKHIVIPYKNASGEHWKIDQYEKMFINAFESAEVIYHVHVEDY